MTVPKRQSLRTLLTRGLQISVTASEPSTIKAELQLSRAVARKLGLRPPATTDVVVGRGTAALAAAGRTSLSVKLTAKARKALRRLRTGRFTLRITATDRAGNAKTVTESLKLGTT